jgi:hypothetical protein
VTYSKSGQNEKEANKQTAFMPANSYISHNNKNSLMLVNIHLAQRKWVKFHQPPMAQQPLAGFTNTDTPNSVDLLWTSDQLDAETSTWHHTTLTKGRYLCPSGIRARNPNKRGVADTHLIQHGHRAWRKCVKIGKHGFKTSLNVSF